MRLVRYLFTADLVAAWAATAGLRETARPARSAEGHEQADQVVAHFRARS